MEKIRRFNAWTKKHEKAIIVGTFAAITALVVWEIKANVVTDDNLQEGDLVVYPNGNVYEVVST